MKLWMQLLLLGTVSTFALGTASAYADHLCEFPTPSTRVYERLLNGGLIVVMRHMETIKVSPKRDCKEAYRVLGDQTKPGHKDALEIRNALDTLRIPVEKVMYSPACRTIDTAEIVFRSLEGMHSTKQLFEVDIDWLTQRLSKTPDNR